MLHFVQIHKEFVKFARSWDDLTLEEQLGYIKRHPKTKRRVTAKLRTEQLRVEPSWYDYSSLIKLRLDLRDMRNARATINLKENVDHKPLTDKEKFDREKLSTDIERQERSIQKLIDNLPSTEHVIKITGTWNEAFIETDNYIITVEQKYSIAKQGNDNDLQIGVTRKDSVQLSMSVNSADALQEAKNTLKMLPYYFADTGTPTVLDVNAFLIVQKHWIITDKPVAHAIDKVITGLKENPPEVQQYVGWRAHYIKSWGFWAFFPDRGIGAAKIYGDKNVTMNGVFVFKDKRHAEEFRSNWNGYIVELH